MRHSTSRRFILAKSPNCAFLSAHLKKSTEGFFGRRGDLRMPTFRTDMNRLLARILRSEGDVAKADPSPTSAKGAAGFGMTL